MECAWTPQNLKSCSDNYYRNLKTYHISNLCIHSHLQTIGNSSTLHQLFQQNFVAERQNIYNPLGVRMDPAYSRRKVLSIFIWGLNIVLMVHQDLISPYFPTLFRRQSVDSLNGGLITSLFCPVGRSGIKKKKLSSHRDFFSCLEKLESVGRVKKKCTCPCHNLQGPSPNQVIAIEVLYS